MAANEQTALELILNKLNAIEKKVDALQYQQNLIVRCQYIHVYDYQLSMVNEILMFLNQNHPKGSRKSLSTTLPTWTGNCRTMLPLQVVCARKLKLSLISLKYKGNTRNLKAKFTTMSLLCTSTKNCSTGKLLILHI